MPSTLSRTLTRIFESNYGYFGSGYHSLYAQVGIGSGYLPYLRLENHGAWTLHGMVKPGAPKPYLAPDGSYVVGKNAGLETAVEFFGAAIDIYWLAAKDGGVFSVAVDGSEPKAVSSLGVRYYIDNCKYLFVMIICIVLVVLFRCSRPMASTRSAGRAQPALYFSSVPIVEA
jgi:hypothetical protein